MKPDIIDDFNELSYPWWKEFDPAKNKKGYDLDIFNSVLDRTDNRTATASFVVKDTESLTARMSPDGYVYKLKWRGSDQY